jgi:mannonate dehydratase
VRERFGFGFHLLHDVHHRLTPIEAARFGKSVEGCRLFWMEDPTPAENQEAFRLIRQHTTTPIAVGEVMNSIWDVQHLITEQLIDYVRTTVVHAGGITHLRRIFDLAALYQVRTGSPRRDRPLPRQHGGRRAPRHQRAELRHPGVHGPRRRDRRGVPHGVTFADGMLHPSEEPGFGVEYDEKAAERFPYQRRYLPVARRLDGSVHDW